ncbi:polyhydroxyalkanoic acid system family protein [Erythrobacter sp. F6033]|uniref:polyhydroxyalkanoic acid system family protein n=1 Tax=Erythrobacter sp. F6033 TaxID=2926401 RepID=UPI001FF28B79|nr:polyhydroxyalkanoic acid system family protein [Erythrobacter sp. F6033]MCK0129352.1 polyhydroxyalkanoic acid system family protein [Erythrobacter sp. F6033]
MRVNLPHDLGKEEVRKRMRERSHEIAGYFPPGMATIETSWSDEDQMDLLVTAAGQRIKGAVEVYDDEVVIEMNLPAMLGFLRGTLESAVRTQATKLLE